jgi:hypothetical protein
VKGKLKRLALTIVAAVTVARWFATIATAAPCTSAPHLGGDPSIAGATALQIELCRARASAGNAPPGLIVKAAQAGQFDVEFGAWTFDLDRVRLETVSAAPASGEKADTFRQRSGAVFAINGGYFAFGPNREEQPVGLFIENGRMKSPLGRALSGTLLIAGHRAWIVPTSSVGDLKTYKFGLQSKPLLVDPGNKLGMRGDDGLRVPRSAICLTDARHVSFFYAGKSGLSLLELATLLQAPTNAGGFACEVALNLDGGPSTQVSADVAGARFERLGQNVANAVIVLPGR